MAKRTQNQNTYIHGEWNAICDVCGFKFKASDLKKRWDGFMTCEDDWEPRHESDFFRAPKEDTSVDWTRPDRGDAGGTDVKGTTFPPAFNVAARVEGNLIDQDIDGLVEGHFFKNELYEATITNISFSVFVEMDATMPEPNVFAGKTFEITSGLGIGETYTISQNTGTTVLVSPPLSANVLVGDTAKVQLGPYKEVEPGIVS